MRWSLLFLLAALSAAAAETPPSARVTLPLKEYLTLVERAEAADRDAARPQPTPPPAAARVHRETTRLVFEQRMVALTATYEVELSGSPPPPAPLPFPGAVASAEVRPASGALSWLDGRPVLLAAEAGRYTVTLTGAAPVSPRQGVTSLRLPGVEAAVSMTILEMPEDHVWRCQGATVARDEIAQGRRIVELARPRGVTSTVEIQRDVIAAEPDRALVHTVVVSLVTVRPEGIRRHEIVLWEVARGGLTTMEVSLPPGFDPERAASDEGEVPLVVRNGRLTVARRTQLTGAGYLVLTSAPAAAAEVPLAPVGTDPPPRARYLAFSSGVAAEPAPYPAGTWRRVDLGDLPEAISRAASGLRLAAAWQLVGEKTDPGMGIGILPPAAELETLVARRETTTLLSREGTVVHRDSMTLVQAGNALSFELPPDTTLWSAAVNGHSVRHIERDGRTMIPLPLGRQAGMKVEVVTVQERNTPKGRSKLTVAAPAVVSPVLVHTWQLLLPQEHRYRWAGGTLTPGPAPTPPKPPAAIERRFDPHCSFTGQVTDTVAPLPGVTVTAISAQSRDRHTAVTSPRGEYRIAPLPPGEYRLRFDLSGFMSVETSIGVLSGQCAVLNVEMPLARLAEEITVAAGSGTWPSRSITREEERELQRLEQAQQKKVFDASIADLRQGLVGGVRPVPVVIPETGKVLWMSGILPGGAATVELDVRARR